MAFAYELAALLDPENTLLAEEERERAEDLRGGGKRTSRRAGRAAMAAISRTQSTFEPLAAPSNWIGYYNNEDHPIRLSIRETTGNEFHGGIEYGDKGTMTKVVGTFGDASGSGDPLFAQLAAAHRKHPTVALSFRETGYEKRGIRSIDFNGEYRAVLTGKTISGAWFASNRLVGYFELTRE
jgi:hypothetical protein